MKQFFYLLILVNMAFFLWRTGTRSGSTHVELEMPNVVERIVLTRESPPSIDAESAGQSAGSEMVEFSETETPPPAPKPPSGEADCFQIGPSRTREEADGLLDLIKTHAADASVVTKSGDVPDGWWVLFPKAETLEAGRLNRRRLAEKGVMDAWLFDRGPLQGAISLGLYKTREEAEAARKPFSDRNIVTEVAPRLVRGDVWWLKVPWHRPALELEEIVQVLNTQDPGLHIPAPVFCD